MEKDSSNLKDSAPSSKKKPPCQPRTVVPALPARSARDSCDQVVCCLGALSLIPGFKKRLITRAAFFPPRPPGYVVFRPNRNVSPSRTTSGVMPSEKQPQVYLFELVRSTSGAITRRPKPLPEKEILSDGVILIRHVEIPAAAKRSCIQAFFLTRSDAVFTLLYSHGNATDIGLMYPHFLDLSRILRVNVLGYDFCGYGATPGVPSEGGLNANISAVFEWLTRRGSCTIPAHRVILYGQSVGSAPTLYLASKVPDLGGVVIHSGMKSAFTVLKENYGTIHWFDAFKNLKQIRRVQMPIFLIHGTRDNEIRIEHAHALLAAAPNARYWWVEGAGHNDIETFYRAEYFAKMDEFLSSLARDPVKLPPKKEALVNRGAS